MTSEHSTPTPPRSPILEDAWTRFGVYDKNAGMSQKRFVLQRKLILGLSVAAAFLAVTYSITKTHEEQVLNVLLGSWLPAQTDALIRKHFLNVFHSLVVLVPIILTALTAYSLKFNMGVNWVMLRSSAEAIKKEIYLYRMRVGEYSPTHTHNESRDMRLARKAKIISKRLLETQVNQSGIEPYKDKLPPLRATSGSDDGFSDLTPDQYITWRIEDQFTYYQKKSVRFGKELQYFQLLIIALGALGAALTAFGFDIWITISSALATALASFLEFKRVETTIVSCNMAAADLYDIRIWWRSLSDSARALQSNIETLVNSTESVIQSENAGWLQEMRDALSEIYGDKEEEQSTDTAQRDQQTTTNAPPQPLVPPHGEHPILVPHDDQLAEMPLEIPSAVSQSSDRPDEIAHDETSEDPQDEEPSVQAVQPV